MPVEISFFLSLFLYFFIYLYLYTYLSCHLELREGFLLLDASLQVHQRGLILYTLNELNLFFGQRAVFTLFTQTFSLRGEFSLGILMLLELFVEGLGGRGVGRGVAGGRQGAQFGLGDEFILGAEDFLDGVLVEHGHAGLALGFFCGFRGEDGGGVATEEFLRGESKRGEEERRGSGAGGRSWERGAQRRPTGGGSQEHTSRSYTSSLRSIRIISIVGWVSFDKRARGGYE